VTYNVWKSTPGRMTPTGPWEFVAAVVAADEAAAVKCIEQRLGTGTYKAYPGFAS
jgi:hypothetical protein